ncbi:MAG TPA: dihydrolipoamide acetyltransferase family protein [Steroidobacteraceae bacterium]|nr:dihydrolipoamide acetyltransferase family protein [Steroidobacteraceae bacterium]
MSRREFRLPDLGEGTVAAEIVAWRVQVGESVREEEPLVEMMTEKATVEVPAPVSGRVVALAGSPGDKVAVGAPLAVFETDTAAAAAAPAAATAPAPPAAVFAASPMPAAASTACATRVATSPAIRRRAHEAGVDLARLAGSGPGGRIMRADFERHLRERSEVHAPATATRTPGAGAAAEVSGRGGMAPVSTRGAPDVQEIPVIGLRRLIAERLSEAARSIPHFSYVEEVDVTELERLRVHLNARPQQPALTYLPFLVLALVRALAAHPQCNARYDAARNVVLRHRAVHVGIATQTPDGLKVPVVRDAQLRSLADLAGEIRRLSEAARRNQATREELGGSTITITSLGRLGGIASTPIINAPELAIIGVNRAVERPVVVHGAIAVRRMMNLSSSFDHRFIDGHDAASFIQALKEHLEHPALMFADPA